MKAIHKQITNLLNKQNKSIQQCHLKRAVLIQQQLESGCPYSKLGGKQLKTDKTLLRFKLGNYRLIIQAVNNKYIPEMLIQRKHLECKLKRR
jgi:mRNA-degrading endonuclease RelE of RelBE toxin-antitoxin system